MFSIYIPSGESLEQGQKRSQELLILGAINILADLAAHSAQLF